MVSRNRATLCIVPNCNSPLTTPKHKIPTTKWIRKKWIAALGFTDVLAQSNIDKYGVCQDHFLKSDYSETSNRRTLITNRVPSINMPSVIQNPQNISDRPSDPSGSNMQLGDIVAEALSGWTMDDSESLNIGDLGAPIISDQSTPSKTEEEVVPDLGSELIKARETIVELSASIAKKDKLHKCLQKKQKQTQQNYTRGVNTIKRMKKLLQCNRFTNWKRLNVTQGTKRS